MFPTEAPDDQAFRMQVREWLHRNKPELPMPSTETADGVPVHLEWERKLHEGRWAAVSWPDQYGGRDASLWQWLIFEEEYYRAGLPQRVAQNGIFLLAPTLLELGTEDQKERYLQRMAAVNDLWCQGWSEPEAGSDLASLRSRAVRDEEAGGWRLYGQKCWTTRGVYCSHMFGIFRTGTPEERHRGLTYFLIDLKQPEITVRPVARLDGDDGFADVFFDGAFVADADVLGGVGQGWRVAMATAGSERSLSLRSPGRFIASADRLIDQYRSGGAEIRDDQRLRQAVADSWMAARAYKLATDGTVSQLTSGGNLSAEASMSKVYWSELDVALHETALMLRGADAEIDEEWMRGYQFALSGPIYAGTNEIQKNIIAERLLGLPRP
ncbi:acyl-CoA dehydrogenase family protein [Mycolicibacterium vinylchloridicum]|uniref:acyl-CoA dehydrogenase family protein n=1 Tax=Mycolicibacterium vinylchloridicum TaxID=2736928 RepID=UPI0015CA25C3|nr:acyl-CoA dehydrogenase family protein [Mycolicibacterium vinylchloridicum]